MNIELSEVEVRAQVSPYMPIPWGSALKSHEYVHIARYFGSVQIIVLESVQVALHCPLEYTSVCL